MILYPTYSAQNHASTKGSRQNEDPHQSLVRCVDNVFKFARRHFVVESDRAGLDNSLSVEARNASKAVDKLAGKDGLAY